LIFLMGTLIAILLIMASKLLHFISLVENHRPPLLASAFPVPEINLPSSAPSAASNLSHTGVRLVGNEIVYPPGHNLPALIINAPLAPAKSKPPEQQPTETKANPIPVPTGHKPLLTKTLTKPASFPLQPLATATGQGKPATAAQAAADKPIAASPAFLGVDLAAKTTPPADSLPATSEDKDVELLRALIAHESGP
jgi:hypothetical protein